MEGNTSAKVNLTHRLDGEAPGRDIREENTMNPVNKWRQMKAYAKRVLDYADWREMKAIHACRHYEFDGQSAEEYCWCPSTLGEYGAARGLNGKSEEICFKCVHYAVGDKSYD